MYPFCFYVFYGALHSGSPSNPPSPLSGFELKYLLKMFKNLLLYFLQNSPQNSGNAISETQIQKFHGGMYQDPPPPRLQWCHHILDHLRNYLDSPAVHCTGYIYVFMETKENVKKNLYFSLVLNLEGMGYHLYDGFCPQDCSRLLQNLATPPIIIKLPTQYPISLAN